MAQLLLSQDAMELDAQSSEWWCEHFPVPQGWQPANLENEDEVTDDMGRSARLRLNGDTRDHIFLLVEKENEDGQKVQSIAIFSPTDTDLSNPPHPKDFEVSGIMLKPGAPEVRGISVDPEQAKPQLILKIGRSTRVRIPLSTETSNAPETDPVSTPNRQNLPSEGRPRPSPVMTIADDRYPDRFQPEITLNPGTKFLAYRRTVSGGRRR